MFACAQDKYEDRVLAGIVYTDKVFKKAALTVNAFSDKAGEKIGQFSQKASNATN